MLRKDVIQRADLALSNLSTDGGLLLPEQANAFIRTVQEQPTILNQARVVPMASPQMNINKIQFGSRILKPAAQASTETQEYANTRRLAPADRSKPTTDQVQLSVKEVIAEVHLPYEVLEDNIEKDQLQSTLLALIAAKAAEDIEELIVNGDTGSGDAYLALLDGVLAQISSHTVDCQNAKLDARILTNVVKALPQKYRNVQTMKYYTTSDAELDIRNAIASRNTGLGDAMLTGKAPVMVNGYNLQGIHKMPAAKGFFTDPRNIVVGFHRDIMLEMDRDIRAREVIFVLSARLDVKLEEEDAVVGLTNVG